MPASKPPSYATHAGPKPNTKLQSVKALLIKNTSILSTLLFGLPLSKQLKNKKRAITERLKNKKKTKQTGKNEFDPTSPCLFHSPHFLACSIIETPLLIPRVNKGAKTVTGVYLNPQSSRWDYPYGRHPTLTF
jgi:hypothetical protein